jgi:hypothetical protein
MTCQPESFCLDVLSIPYQYPNPTLNGDGAIEPMRQRLLQLQDELHRYHGGLQAN